MHSAEPATSTSLKIQSSSITRKAEKRATGGEEKRIRKWVEENIAFELPDDNRKLQFTDKDWALVEVFEFFLYHDLMNLIIPQSVFYAK